MEYNIKLIYIKSKLVWLNNKPVQFNIKLAEFNIKMIELDAYIFFTSSLLEFSHNSDRMKAFI